VERALVELLAQDAHHEEPVDDAARLWRVVLLQSQILASAPTGAGLGMNRWTTPRTMCAPSSLGLLPECSTRNVSGNRFREGGYRTARGAGVWYKAAVSLQLQSYGPWAVVAGASEGLGAAFAQTLAAQGRNLVLIARRVPALEALAQSLRERHGIEVRTVCCDLGAPDMARSIAAAVDGVEIGIGIYNAAYSSVGPFLDRPLEEALRVVDVNIRGPLQFVHAIAPSMIARRRGGLVLMSSLAGLQGAPHLAAYAASKAFNAILAESLWAELRPKGVDVLVSCAGAIRTPGYLEAATGDAPGTLDPDQVVLRTLEALGKGPRIVPGGVNKLAAFLLTRMIPRRTAIFLMGSSTTSLKALP
jgi:short-subunit dehydrogenase